EADGRRHAHARARPRRGTSAARRRLAGRVVRAARRRRAARVGGGSRRGPRAARERLGRNVSRVCVVGAGVIGLACAWELARGDAEVVVLDSNTAGAGVSRGNAGWVCPTITAPLPAPGMVREGLRQLVTRGD